MRAMWCVCFVCVVCDVWRVICVVCVVVCCCVLCVHGRFERTHENVLNVHTGASLSSLLASLFFSCLSLSFSSLSVTDLNNNDNDNDRSSSWLSLYTRP